jgi:hypothetical protein
VEGRRARDTGPAIIGDSCSAQMSAFFNNIDPEHRVCLPFRRRLCRARRTVRPPCAIWLAGDKMTEAQSAESHSPSVVVLGGPNGAGKSTAAPRLLRGSLRVDAFVNADTLAQGLSAFRPEDVAIQVRPHHARAPRSPGVAASEFCLRIHAGQPVAGAPLEKTEERRIHGPRRLLVAARRRPGHRQSGRASTRWRPRRAR